MPRRAMRRPRRARRAARKSRVPRSLRTKGFDSKIHTIDFKLASQTLRSGIGTGELPITLNSGEGVGVLLPLTAPSGGSTFYSQQLSLNSSTLGLPSYYDLGFGLRFNIAQIANIAAWTQCWDQYRINYVKMEIENVFPAESVGVAGTVARPENTLYIAQDFDDDLVPITQSIVSGHSGCRMISFGHKDKTKTTYVFRPKPVLVMENETPGTNYPPLVSGFSGVGKRGTWMNSANAAVNYYGAKMYYTNWLATGLQQQMSGLRFTFTFNLSFKQPLRAY